MWRAVAFFLAITVCLQPALAQRRPVKPQGNSSRFAPAPKPAKRPAPPAAPKPQTIDLKHPKAGMTGVLPFRRSLIAKVLDPTHAWVEVGYFDPPPHVPSSSGGAPAVRAGSVGAARATASGNSAPQANEFRLVWMELKSTADFVDDEERDLPQRFIVVGTKQVAGKTVWHFKEDNGTTKPPSPPPQAKP